MLRFQRLFAAFSQGGFPVMVDANVPRDGVEPWKHRLAATVGVAHLMDAHPGFLEKVVGMRPAHHLHQEKAMQLRAQTMDKGCGGFRIALLVASHQGLQIDVQTHVKRNAHPIIAAPLMGPAILTLKRRGSSTSASISNKGTLDVEPSPPSITPRRLSSTARSVGGPFSRAAAALS